MFPPRCHDHGTPYIDFILTRFLPHFKEFILAA